MRCFGNNRRRTLHIKNKNKKEISKLVYFTTYDEKDGIKTERACFSKSKRKRLSNLLVSLYLLK